MYLLEMDTFCNDGYINVDYLCIDCHTQASLYVSEQNETRGLKDDKDIHNQDVKFLQEADGELILC